MHLAKFESFLKTQTGLYEEVKNTESWFLKYNKPLIISTSTRWSGSDDVPKSKQLAMHFDDLHPNSQLIDASKLKLYYCEGNVSDASGNHCGEIKARLKDKTKNPSGQLRCWASYNNEDDELHKIITPLFDGCDLIWIFGSVRWGQANSVYQKLIERLTWLENRHSNLEQDNPIENISAACAFMGHNWNGENVRKTCMQVLDYFGFNLDEKLCFNYQWTQNSSDESENGYQEDVKEFQKVIDKL